jgi:hypothetical protein
MHRGAQIFPPLWDNAVGRAWKAFRNNIVNLGIYRYNRRALQRVLEEFLGEKILGESKLRHVIPSFDGRFSEVFIFKTRHHSDYANGVAGKPSTQSFFNSAIIISFHSRKLLSRPRPRRPSTGRSIPAVTGSSTGAYGSTILSCSQ